MHGKTQSSSIHNRIFEGLEPSTNTKYRPFYRRWQLEPSLSRFVTAGLVNTFSAYGPLTVEWPGKDGKHPRCPPKGNVAKGKVNW